jgi:hypothetical protein
MLMLPAAARAEAFAAAPAPGERPGSPRLGKVLTGAGAATFTVAYLTTATLGGLLALGSAGHSPERYTPLLIPVAGPFMAASRNPGSRDRVLWYASGGLQIAGLAVCVTGLVLQRGESRDTRLSWELSVTPAGTGIRASGRF